MFLNYSKKTYKALFIFLFSQINNKLKMIMDINAKHKETQD